MERRPISEDTTSSFDDLPIDEQSRIKSAGLEMVKLAQKHALAIIIARRPGAGGSFNSASGFILAHNGKFYLVTAAHVLSDYERLREKDGQLRWQVGEVILPDPAERLVLRDPLVDLVLFALRPEEVPRVPVTVASPLRGWPPPRPSAGRFVLVSGYPAIVRERVDERRVEFNALSAMFEVTTSGDYHVTCQLRREFLVGFDEHGLPPPGADFGGMSGGPVFLVEQLSYPVVGAISEFHVGFELLRVGLFAGADFLFGLNGHTEVP